ncbi:ATP-NAD kinase family protein [Cuniculiplasma sp. SKW3]|uniref:ATP-NAD kinase family protein n=1 Tax=Cuniculiplasma sp. SKW3 TaxID=3400170 RepID=UPI003FD00330
MQSTIHLISGIALLFLVRLIVGFLLNPVAGSGIYHHVNGSDRVRDDNCGYSELRATEFLDELDREINFITASGAMGEDILRESGFTNLEICHRTRNPSTPDDTKEFIKEIRGKCQILVFVGGDGTARDVLVSKPDVPVIGVPAGMKMYSSVFSYNPRDAAQRLQSFIDGSNFYITTGVVEDADENEMEKGQLSIKKHGELNIVTKGEKYSDPKIVRNEWSSDSILEFLLDDMDDSYYIIGTGGTCKSLMEKMGLKTSIFQIDLIRNRKLIKGNLYPEDFGKFVEKGASLKIVVSPYGGSGYFLGRGNRQISSEMIMQAGKSNIIIISSIDKLSTIKVLKYDVEGLPKNFFGNFVKVLTGYGTYTMVPVMGS